jgi:drug/metabolite transporter (DMT)-like permease
VSATRPAPTASRPLLAFAWMLGAVASFTLMAVAGREIQVEMNTFELMLYRSVIGFAVVAAVVASRPRGFGLVATRHPALHVKRNLWHYAGQNLWFFAVATIPSPSSPRSSSPTRSGWRSSRPSSSASG